MLEPGYAYVRLRAFQERTDEDLEKTLAKLHKEAGGTLPAASCSTCATTRAACSTRP